MVTFSDRPTSPRIKMQTMSTRWLANPKQRCNHFLHRFLGSYEYVIHCQIEWSYSSPPPDYVDYRV